MSDTNYLWVKESPIEMVVGETVTYSVTFEGITTCSSPSAKVYRNETDITSTAMPSGSASASGNVVTLKPLVALSADGDEIYIVAITATADGNTEIRKCEVYILKVDAR